MKINRRSVLKMLAALPWIGPALLKAKPPAAVLNQEWVKADSRLCICITKDSFVEFTTSHPVSKWENKE